MHEWPLIGRDADVRRLITLLDDSSAHGVVLAGPAGVGKTRLGRECLRLAGERGFAIERISATNATSSLPLGSITLSRPRHLASVRPTEQPELVHWIVNELQQQAENTRLAIMIDDVHWLDPLSAVVVHHLAASDSIFLILTSRTGSPVPGPIVALWKDNAIERMSVAPIGREFVEPLLSEALGGPIARAAIVELADSSDGNLLFLREQVHAAVEGGTLTCDAGVWRLSGVPGAQPRLIELVEHRLAGLHPAAREYLEVVAFGEPLELTDALEMAGEDLVQWLEQRDLVAIRPDGWGGGKMLLGHPLIGEVLRAGTSVMRARQITKKLTTAAEQHGPHEPDDLLRIASWRLVCGGGSADLLQRATRAAYARHDYALAVRIGRAAITAGAGFPARLLLAEAIGFTGHRSQAESDLAALAGEAVSPDQQAAVAHARLVNAELSGDMALASRVYREALEAIHDPRWRDELIAKRSWMTMAQEGPRAGLNDTNQLWNHPVDGSPLIAAGVIRAAALARTGRTTEALAVTARVRGAQERLNEPFDLHRLAIEMFSCEALTMAGRLRDAEHLAQACYDEAIRERSATMELWFSYQGARIALVQGRVGTASRLAGEAVGIARQIRDPILLGAGLAVLAEALAYLGQIDAAGRALAELGTVAHTPWFFAEPGISHAWLDVARGDLGSARKALAEEVDRSLAWNDLRSASLALHSMVRLGAAKAARIPLAEIATCVEGDLVPTQARHAAAVVDRNPADLMAVAESFADMGANLLAAEVFSDAAVALRAEGNIKPAAVAARRAALLLECCEGATTPAVQPVTLRAELTPAERATAMLAAQGWSNKSIAAAEQVSLRTVESRLQCTYTKLGISSRRDLAYHLEGGAED